VEKTPILLKHLPPVSNLTPDAILMGFLSAVEEKGLTLYPAQEEAVLEIMAGKNVILATPTGSGKSLVALAMHFKALAEGKRSYYTCPIKALVSEKFFSLCNDFGPENVGMMTGDASVNKDAPIICCTAEILANVALADFDKAPVEYAICDEFHYYADPERGAAWQIPLLTLSNTTFLLMSATIGDTTRFETSLKELNHKDVAVVKGGERPVPLDFEYRETPIHETVYELISAHKFPIYVVNFTQRECVEQSQNLMSVNFCTKEEKKTIEEAFRGFRFDSPFGKDVKRYISHGIGLHHAGLLPKYRLLVEKLTQQGLLKVIMGTDTLGVGINVPIRTVLFTKLCKFDGVKNGILSARDFKQIAGRAGRKGYDQEGSVVCQAPEHVIENKKLESKFSQDGKKKKFTKREAPSKNYTHWDEKTFRRLIEQTEEILPSQFTVSHGMIVTMLAGCAPNYREGYRRLIQLIRKCHETLTSKRKLRRRSALLLRSLIKAGVILKEKRGIIINPKMDKDFSLNHALSLYLLHALELLDPADPEYALNVLTLVESITENPRTILQKQVDHLKTQKMAELKAEFVEYDQRIEELEKIEHPKPLREFIYTTFNAFADVHPWVEQENIQPKSIAREMVEQIASFNEYVKEYGLERSEGVLLRQLSQTYKILVQTVPESFKTQEVWDIQVGIRTLLGRVDSSLVDEWEKMFKPQEQKDAKIVSVPVLFYAPDTNPKPFIARVRSDMFAFIAALGRGNYEDAAAILRPSSTETWSAEKLHQAFDPFYDEHERLIIDPRARAGELSQIQKSDDNLWRVRQTLLDPEEANDWFVEAEVHVDASLTPETPVLQLVSIGK
jgi:superfamily II RNA helicase